MPFANIETESFAYELDGDRAGRIVTVSPHSTLACGTDADERNKATGAMGGDPDRML